MKTVILTSAIILSITSLFTASAFDKDLKKVNTTVSVINTLPVTIEAQESHTIKTSENALEKAQYTPEQKAAIVGLEFRSVK